MAIESVTANAGSGGDSFAVDTITGSVQVPYTKIMSGTDAAEDLIGGDAANGLDVDVTRVSGTVTVDGSGVTQPISAASLPLPTGAATAAKQPALGTAGTASADVITVQGIASMTALTVDGSGATQPVSHAALTELAAAINASSQLDINIAAQAGDITVASHAVTNAGTFATQVTSIAAGDNNIGNVDIVSLPASTNTLEVVGDGAHDAAIAGNPVRIAGRGMSADFTAVTTGDTADVLATLLGKLVNVPYALPGNSWSYASPAAVTDTADDAAKASAGAGIRNYITGVQVFNGHDTVGTEVVIKDGATVIWRGWAEQTGGGCSARFDPPLRGTAATAVNVANITTGSSTYFNLQGFVAAE